MRLVSSSQHLDGNRVVRNVLHHGLVKSTVVRLTISDWHKVRLTDVHVPYQWGTLGQYGFNGLAIYRYRTRIKLHADSRVIGNPHDVRRLAA